jgi:SPP1 gp7 family putative phage head morphogenesis protein
MSGSETGGGSYSLGVEQFGIFYVVIESQRKQIEELVDENIIKPLVNLNFGGDIDCNFRFQAVGDANKLKYLELFSSAIRDGAISQTGIEQINWFLKSINAPEINEEDMPEEPNITTPPKQPEEGVEEAEEKPEQSPEEEVKENEQKDYGDNGTNQIKSAKEYQKYYRELTVYEKKVDFPTIEEGLKKLYEKNIPIISDSYTNRINLLLEQIEKRKIVENKRFDLIPRLQISGRKELKKEWKRSLKEGALFGKATIVKTYDAAIPQNEVAEWILINADYIENVEAANILKVVAGTLQDGIRKGQSYREIKIQILDQLNGYTIDNTSKELIRETTGKAISAARVETIVRTNIHKAFSEQRMQELTDLEPDITGYQYSAILDNRTSPVCEALDGKNIKKEEIVDYNPPLHYNCRSIIVPIFKDEPFDGFSKLPNTEPEKGGFRRLG